ncbi:hypothetical protein ABZ883_14800 [Streptomyces sp. NPDC046977]|uniref:hypothetical protein n=1 Tax=Streptomyces sp. NPDC046977 TaxID=3154703 RepID=UPI00340DE64E
MRFKLFGRDAELAKTKYAGRESATDKAARERRTGHRNGGADRAARAGQAWTDREFDRLR